MANMLGAINNATLNTINYNDSSSEEEIHNNAINTQGYE